MPAAESFKEKENKQIVEVRCEAPAKAPPVELQAGHQPEEVVVEEPVVEDGRPLPQVLEEGYKKSFVKGWRANALFPQKKQCR